MVRIETVRLVFLDCNGFRRETVYLPHMPWQGSMRRDCERFGRKPLYVIRVRPKR